MIFDVSEFLKTKILYFQILKKKIRKNIVFEYSDCSQPDIDPFFLFYTHTNFYKIIAKLILNIKYIRFFDKKYFHLKNF